jgi:hypothetical protein
MDYTLLSGFVLTSARIIPKLLGNAGFSKTGSNHIRGMKPKNQSFISTDGLYAENAGAIFCLVQGFITKKMVASRLALRELSQEASAALPTRM